VPPIRRENYIQRILRVLSLLINSFSLLEPKCKLLNCVKEIRFYQILEGLASHVIHPALHDHSSQMPDAYLLGYPSQRASDDQIKQTPPFPFLARSYSSSVICQLNHFFSSQVAGRFLGQRAFISFLSGSLLVTWRMEVSSR
jgi:hypothetical protein